MAKSWIVVFCLTIGLLVTPMAGLAAGPEEGLLSALSSHEKLSRPDAVLAPFHEGKDTARVIVTLNPPAEFDQVKSLKKMDARAQRRAEVGAYLGQVTATLPPTVELTNTFQYQFGFSAKVTLEDLNDLLSRDEVLVVEEDGIQTAHLAQGIPLMNASTIRSSYNGSGLAVAISDTGIDYTHPRLGASVFPNSKVLGGRDTGDDDDDPMDLQGHGTSVAGIVAGELGTSGDYIGGLAYNAKLYALKISYGSGGSAYNSDTIEAWEWVITHQNDNASYPIMIINHSFGGSRYSTVCDASETAYYNAAANVYNAGITIFASSGNDGYCTEIARPACVSPIISVGAVYDASLGTVGFCVSSSSCAPKSYSAGCSTLYAAFQNATADLVTSYSNTAGFLDLLASSNDAYTTDIVGAGGGSSGDYRSDFGGTSAASPYAAGAGAIIQTWYKAKHGNWASPAELRSLMKSTGDIVTDPKTDTAFPRVNVGNVLGSKDVIWRHTNGRYGTWLLNNLAETSWVYLGDHGVWDIRGVGDFNNDGHTDVLWRHPSTGAYGVWLMNGTTESSWSYIGNNGTAWDIKGVADFNSDGKDDILWRHNSTANCGVWLMDGVTQSSWQYIGNHGSAWDVKGIGDINNDRMNDIIWRHTGGNYGVWYMNGTTESSWQFMGNHGTAWDIKGVADLNHDGHDDLVFRHSGGNCGVWLLDGTTEISWHLLGNHGTSWDVKGVDRMN